MSNVLQVIHQEAIRSLFQQGWSQRRIARELGLHRGTVRGYVETLSKCTTISTAGSAEEAGSKCATISTAGTESVGLLKVAAESITGKPGPKSLCLEFADTIEAKLEAGLSAQRIYQDLVLERGYGDSYESVKRFVRKLKATAPKRVWRMECQPGEEMQVDFGVGAPIEAPGAKAYRSWVFRAVLSFSRRGYSEAVARQDTETFIRCLENAVRYFGGSPQLVNLDNLKAAVLKADWFDPQINPKLADFCRHYGMHIMPCRPYTPQHKGKIERGVGYVKSNALKDRRFTSLAAENAYLLHWETTVADTRIHGTTCKQVAAAFEEERPHLLALPATLFSCYQEARRQVSRDSFVEVQKAYYEAPPEYIGRQVWARWDGRCVRLFNDRFEQVQIHSRIEAGRFSRILGAAGFSAPVLSSCRHWVDRAAVIGEHCGAWAQAALDARGPEAMRAIMGLCGLVKKHSATALDGACAKALQAGTKRLKDVQRMIDTPTAQQDFAFAEKHELIRNLQVYADFINQPPPIHNDKHPQTISDDPEALGAA